MAIFMLCIQLAYFVGFKIEREILCVFYAIAPLW